MSKTTIPTGGLADDAVNLTSKVTGTLPVANGGTALTSGFFNGITECDMWRYTANTTGDLDPIASNLERVDTVFDKIGTGMSESSGIFTFPSTGIYEIVYNAYSFIDGENRDGAAHIQATTDNSSYTDRAKSTTSQFHASSSNTSANATATLIFDVTNVTTHKVKFTWAVENDDARLYGETGATLTYFKFTRLGDT